MYRRIVVPLDGSELAERALGDAEELARLTNAPLHLVRVVDVAQIPWYGQFGMAMEYGMVEQGLTAESAAATAYLQAMGERIAEHGLVADAEVRRGSTTVELLATIQPGDLIVMASHGRGGIARWILGSVAEHLLRHATVPIVLVKAITQTTDEHASEGGPASAAASINVAG